ncbi:hypothetical protein ZIOFF_005021 [Zingiber officinale]|uniref:Uncharacterized protein n=1 Tax=Zingiber officinale TaxID=94328 RepID=A0A8J5I133_ZINOF|nr:hypothetical protein ZIOFF_005021 [Zingiber officinale]
MRQGDCAEEFASECQKATAIKYSGELGTGKEMGEGRVRSGMRVLFTSAGSQQEQMGNLSDNTPVLYFLQHRTGDMELEILGMNFGCVLGALQAWEFPEKDCLLPPSPGYCIVAASTIVKLPQILKILKHNSVRGLSLVSFELEVVGYTIALAYSIHKGLPFSAYGEFLFLLIQGFTPCHLFLCKSTPNMDELQMRVFTSIQENAPVSGILLIS